MTTNLSNKIDNLIKITPNYKVKDVFLVGKEQGWSDGCMADLTDFYFEIAKSEAVIRHGILKNGLSRFNLDRENGADLNKPIPDCLKSEFITDIEYCLEDNTCFLISENYKVKFNPKYLKYFYKAYKPFWNGLVIKVNGVLDPITIYFGNEIKGLIMPQRYE